MSRVPDYGEFEIWKAEYKARYAKPIENLGEVVQRAFEAGSSRFDIGSRSDPDVITDDRGVRYQRIEDHHNDLIETREVEKAATLMNAAEVQAVDIGRVRLLGYDAGAAGQSAECNPFIDKSDEFYSWYRYWLSGNKDFHWRRGEKQPTPPHMIDRTNPTSI